MLQLLNQRLIPVLKGSWLGKFLSVACLLLGLVQLAFMGIQAQMAQKAETAIASAIMSTNSTLNPYYFSQSITGLERGNLVSCVRIRNTTLAVPFYESAPDYCRKNTSPKFLLAGEIREISIRSANGQEWKVSFQAENGPLFSLSLWVLRLSLLLGAGVFFAWNEYRLRQRNRIEALREKGAQDLTNLASQVAHDIRSPLAALNMILDSVGSLPEEKRLIIRNATQRINDIANSLIKREIAQNSKITVPNAKPKLENTMIAALLDSIVSEKRVQYRQKMLVDIQGDLSEGYGLFAQVEPAQLARAVSNSINNSVEAFGDSGGKVRLSVRAEGNEKLVVRITDNGKGIPKEILEKLGIRGVSHGKAENDSGSGAGLGVYQAKTTMDNSGGSFAIESEEGKGTTVILGLPKSKIPSWFLEKLQWNAEDILVSVDDDQTIHQIWAGRLQSLPGCIPPLHISFTSIRQCSDWLKSQDKEKHKFLVDYEFLHQEGNGLDFIEANGIAEQSILVTSRYEEPAIQARAQSLGVKMLPKGLAAYVPMSAKKPLRKYDAVLIDDDSLVHQTWKMVADHRKKSFLFFYNPEDFYQCASEVHLDTPIFVDVNLANGIRGEAVAQEVNALGFSEIHLATGYSPRDLKKPDFVRSVVGKEPIY